MTGTDFTKAPLGMLVKHSPHWLEQACQKRAKLGILVDRRFYETVSGGVQCWPVIHWQDDACSSITHPTNAVAKQPRQTLPTVELEDLKSRQPQPA